MGRGPENSRIGTQDQTDCAAEAALQRDGEQDQLVDDPKRVQDQLLRLGQTLVRVEVKDKRGLRAAHFPLFSRLALETNLKEGKTRWRVRLSGDFHRVLRHTAPTVILEAQVLPAPA